MPTKTRSKKARRSAPTRPARAPRPRQTSIPGTEGPAIPEVDRAAQAYVDIRDSRMGLTEQETVAQATLLTVMRKHTLTVYRLDMGDGPMLVSVNEGQAKVSVRKVKEKAPANGDGA